MQVFKTYFKIIKKQLGQLSIYVGVFLGIAVMLSNVAPTIKIDSFTQSKTRVVFLNEDENSALVQGFKSYLGEHSVYVNIPDDTERLQDALFFRDAEYILKIPRGFTKNIMSGKRSQIEKTVVTGSTSGMYTDMLVNKYLNTVRLYLSNNKDITQEELVRKVAVDLQIETKVNLEKTKGKRTDSGSIKYYFNYLPYVIINVLILGVSSIMMVYNNKNLRRRNLCSPLNNTAMNLQILLGNIIFSIVSWALTIGCGFLIYREKMLTINTVYFCINSFIITITVLSLSFLVGVFVKSKNAQSGISNVLSLGLCFLSGVFVPQEVLSQKVLSIAKFTPTYWYVKANNMISSMTDFSLNSLSPVLKDMFIELGFAVALLSVTLLMSRRKQMKGE